MKSLAVSRDNYDGAQSCRIIVLIVDGMNLSSRALYSGVGRAACGDGERI